MVGDKEEVGRRFVKNEKKEGQIFFDTLRDPKHKQAIADIEPEKINFCFFIFHSLSNYDFCLLLSLSLSFLPSRFLSSFFFVWVFV